MSYNDWYVGMKVVCVDGSAHSYIRDAISPRKGGVYTIRNLEANPRTGRLNVQLCEIVNPEVEARDGCGEPYFGASRFRPVQTRKTDISIFTAMLQGAKDKVQA